MALSVFFLLTGLSPHPLALVALGRDWLLGLAGDLDGEIRTADLAEQAGVAGLGVGHVGAAVVILGQDLLGAESGAEAAFFAPGAEKLDPGF